VLIIEVDRCNGCEACVQACPQGAISLVEGIARIDSSLCAECQTCVNVCPTGAIHVAMPIVQREAREVAFHEERSPVSTVPRGTLATLTAATLTFMGRYLLPRAAEALMTVLARRPSRGSGMTGPRPSASSTPGTRATTGTAGPPGGRRRRRRGGW
jgi:NAD-dependent dihydropyrimidine dehydrogenase PreA subunit